MLKHLNKKQNWIAQIGLIALHTMAQMPELGAPLAGSPVPNIVFAIAQAIIAIRAHSVNPDGTPASQPYRPQR